jgi:hypothetical protein
MQSEPRRIALGTLVLEGEEMEFEAETLGEIAAKPGELLELILAYRYTEPSHDEDTTRIVLTAELEGAKLGSVQETIEDEKLLDDSRRSYLSLPFRVAGNGRLQGRFSLRVVYTRRAWEGGDAQTRTFEREGSLRLRVA